MELIATIFTFWWLWLLIGFAATEVVSIRLRYKMRQAGYTPNRLTFSWHVWWTRRQWVTRAPVFALATWAYYHFYFEPTRLISTPTDDLIVAALALVGGIFFIDPRGQ